MMQTILRKAMTQHVSNLYVQIDKTYFMIPMDDTNIYSIPAELLDYLSASSLPKCIQDFGIISSAYLISLHPMGFLQEKAKPDVIPVLTRDDYPNTCVHYVYHVPSEDYVVHRACTISGHISENMIQACIDACPDAIKSRICIKRCYPTLSDADMDAAQVNPDTLVETFLNAITDHC